MRSPSEIASDEQTVVCPPRFRYSDTVSVRHRVSVPHTGDPLSSRSVMSAVSASSASWRCTQEPHNYAVFRDIRHIRLTGIRYLCPLRRLYPLCQSCPLRPPGPLCLLPLLQHRHPGPGPSGILRHFPVPFLSYQAGPPDPISPIYLVFLTCLRKEKKRPRD